MKILSIQIGKPINIEYQGNIIKTGIFKYPVQGSVYLTKLGLEGDGQADLSVHGGIDKALYAYAFDAYSLWKNLRPSEELSYGAFGENICFDQLPEDKIYIGDTYELGESIVQVSQPRLPCYKLAAKFKDSKILKQFMELNRPGVYFRVLKEGKIIQGDALIKIQEEKVKLSITDLFNFKQNKNIDLTQIKEILTLQSLPSHWKKNFEALL